MARLKSLIATKRLASLAGMALAAVFIAGVAFTGTHREKPSSAYVSGHHAECVSVQAPSPVNAGQSYNAVVRLSNQGTSTWSPNYGFYLKEYNNGNNGNRWNASGTNLSRDYPPGSTAAFNLIFHAPSTGGTYPFNWAITIAYQGYVLNPCSGTNITVNGPPGGLKLSSPSKTASSVALSWTEASNTSWYHLYRNNHSVADGIKRTTYNNTGLACKTTYKYQVYSVNSYGTTGSNAINVTTNGCPTSHPSGGSTGGSSGGSSSGGSSSSGSSTATPPSPHLQGSTNTSPRPDKTAPTPPNGLAASVDETTAAVQLSWRTVIDSSGIKAYQVDRSTDQHHWQTLTATAITTGYLDSSVNFNTHYFYRVRATDNAGNKSKYASTSATTPAFAANAFPDKDNTINDEFNNLAVLIPTGALSEAALCDVSANAAVLPPTIKGYKTVDGPYELTCKNAVGSLLTFVASPTVSWTTSAAARSGVSNKLAYYGFKDGNWQNLQVSSRDNKNRTDQVVLGDSTVFAAMGQLKHTPLLVKILLVLLILAAIGALVMVFLVLRIRRQKQGRYDDYIHKEYGI